MLRLLLIGIIVLSFALTVMAEQNDSTFIFTGYILDTDSLPVENAYLINYRSLRAYATDENGQFKVPFQKGDSLKVHHVSYDPIIVKPLTNGNMDRYFYLKYDTNILEIVDVKYKDIEMEYFHKNMENIRIQLAREYHYDYEYKRSVVVTNPYAPKNPANNFVGLNLFDLLHIISKMKE